MLAEIETSASPCDVLARFQQIRKERQLRHRDAARELRISECEAVASSVGARGELSAVRFAGPWPELFEELPFIGTVMALTRNETTVHEKTGAFENMSHEGALGLALGADIDLRIFYGRWSHAYAVSEETQQGMQRSLQIYDAVGTAVHKVFLREASDLAAWMEFVERHAHTNQAPGERIEPAGLRAAPSPDTAIDVGAFHQAWSAMQDTHEFFPLLRKFKLARTQALRLAPTDFAYRVEPVGARIMLQDAARISLSIMCFVGNPGMIQIHTGPVKRVEIMGDWLNVLDLGFNLHLREDRIAAVWVVKKPTADGVVTSLELFDAVGDTMAMFFGERKPGKHELAGWRALIDALPPSEP